ncbi:hypothetical protein [Bacillus sp. NPDC094077]|uniref:hypothetical protein n=1 Tax=Bacillus sp. NPDC094077 TaxID=3390932 RepID=UPI003D049175
MRTEHGKMIFGLASNTYYYNQDGSSRRKAPWGVFSFFQKRDKNTITQKKTDA